MRIDARQPIAGIRPSMLKQLLRRGHFDTPTAIRTVGIPEPTITAALQKLEREDWVIFKETRNGVDQWEVGNHGQRLLATRLMSRISQPQGRLILSQVRAEARRINAENWHVLKITRLLLFGSLLDEQAAIVGDVDLYVEFAGFATRDLSEDDAQRLLEADHAACHSSESLSQFDPELSLKRRLRRCSRHVSLHPSWDIFGRGNPYREVYCYDPKLDCELKPAPGIQHPSPSSHFVAPARHAEAPNSRRARAWPGAPWGELRVSLSEDDALLAQHLWQNGLSLEDISDRTALSPVAVQAYLAVRPTARLVKPVIHASLKATVQGAFPRGAGFSVVAARISRKGAAKVSGSLEIKSARGESGVLSLRSKEYQIYSATIGAIGVLEQITRTIPAWWASAVKGARGLDVIVSVAPSGHCVRETSKCRRRKLDIARLRVPMLKALHEALAQLPQKGGRSDHFLRLTLSPAPTLRLMALAEEAVSDLVYSEVTLMKAPASFQPILEVAADLWREFPEHFDEGLTFEVELHARQLYDEGLMSEKDYFGY